MEINPSVPPRPAVSSPPESNHSPRPPADPAPANSPQQAQDPTAPGGIEISSSARQLQQLSQADAARSQIPGIDAPQLAQQIREGIRQQPEQALAAQGNGDAQASLKRLL